MKLNKAIESLEKEKIFLDWKKEHDDAYLCYAMCMLTNDVMDTWNIGYYSKIKDRISTFAVKGEVELTQDEEVFQKQKKSVNKIDMEKVKLDLDKALDIALRFQEKNYSNQIPLKKIVILQDLDKVGLVWNVTYVTMTFSTLNMKVGAEDGKVKEDLLTTLWDFRKS